MSIYLMKLHEETKITDFLFVIRVPGGWIYLMREVDYSLEHSIFVPYHNEFQE